MRKYHEIQITMISSELTQARVKLWTMQAGVILIQIFNRAETIAFRGKLRLVRTGVDRRLRDVYNRYPCGDYAVFFSLLNDFVSRSYTLRSNCLYAPIFFVCTSTSIKQ